MCFEGMILILRAIFVISFFLNYVQFLLFLSLNFEWRLEIGDFLDRTDWVLATECIPDGRDLYGVLKNKNPGKFESYRRK